MTALVGALDAFFAELEPIGRAAAGGYDRFAWTAEDAAMRAVFRRHAECRALPVEQDRNGNLWAFWPAPGPSAVATGSHLDSVPGGGAFDGPLGVVSSFLALDLLRERHPEPFRRPLALCCFADEEGARFGTACVGSRLATGALAPAAARRLRDRDGVTLERALAGAGVDPSGIGADPGRLGSLAAFVELHVEQGRGLARLGAPVGVASAIWPHGRWRMILTGEANHAGTTLLGDRRDPMLAFAGLVSAARAAAAAEGALATVGKVSASPGAANAVAAVVEAWLDARAASEEALSRVVGAVRAAAELAADAEGVALAVREESRTPETRFDAALAGRVAAAVEGVVGVAPLLPTGAGHDAGILAAALPTAMLFVRNPTGASHSAAEHAEREDCATGVEALAAVLQDLLDGEPVQR